ncbi:MAG: hypothetical protein KatS3mg077_0067 [Candidatus Binatia bacterium]|nr:MAG: hypothetical protein KatS3mg077_0067 [Candidatus Binatia bacterium]
MKTLGSLCDLSVEVLPQVSKVDRDSWNALVEKDHPFLEWDWLSGLEETGCVSRATGWQPHHLIAWRGDRLEGFCPAYVKSHSRGEFIYDFSWAEAAERAGIRYYPKLVVGVPFTPANGRRFLMRRGRREHAVRTFGTKLMELCHGEGFSSVHVNFCLEEEARVLSELGYLERVGYQFHWVNHGWASFEDYLGALRAKRRNQIRRERRTLKERGIQIEVLSGPQITAPLMDTMYALYARTVEKHFWSGRYLSRKFFRLLAERFAHHLRLSVALREGRVLAGALAVAGQRTLYGRYWGAFEDVKFLHFEVCYYRLIEHCLETGLDRFEPGAGGDFKEWRGFAPVPTYSAHYFRDPRLHRAVGRWLERERAQVEQELSWWATHGSYRRGA